jgi:gluconokinase
MWLKKHLPEIFSRAYKFIGIKEYIWYKLFGKFEVDYGIASATGLLETGRLGWFPDALSYAGISESQLSLPVSPYHVQTLNNSAILADLGLRHPVPCVIGSSDGCLAHLGSMAMHHDSISLTIGTSGAVRRVARSSQPDLLGRTFRYHLDAETIIEGGATNNGAILLDWYSKNFLNKETNTESFIAAAASIRAGSEGLIFLPYVFGERSPHNDPDATGVFLGVRQHHTHAHFMRAILEGIGFSLHSIAGLLEQSSGRYSRVMASGGFTRSAIWVQVIADIFGRPVSVSPYEDASALGAAMVGFQAIGEDFRPAHAGASTFTPDISAHAEYARMFAIFQKLYDPLRGSFHQLSNPGH